MLSLHLTSFLLFNLLFSKDIHIFHLVLWMAVCWKTHISWFINLKAFTVVSDCSIMKILTVTSTFIISRPSLVFPSSFLSHQSQKLAVWLNKGLPWQYKQLSTRFSYYSKKFGSTYVVKEAIYKRLGYCHLYRGIIHSQYCVYTIFFCPSQRH